MGVKTIAVSPETHGEVDAFRLKGETLGEAVQRAVRIASAATTRGTDSSVKADA